MSTRSIFIVDDDYAVRQALRWLVIGAGLPPVLLDGASALDSLLRGEPRTRGVILLDLQMPRYSGQQLMRDGLARRTHMPVIILTAHADVPLTVELFEQGAVSLMEKPPETAQFVSLLERALAEEEVRWGRLLEVREAEERLSCLTAREREILGLLVRGLSNRELADVLGISHRTVENHRRALLRKLDIRKIVEAAYWLATIEANG